MKNLAELDQNERSELISSMLEEYMGAYAEIGVQVMRQYPKLEGRRIDEICDSLAATYILNRAQLMSIGSMLAIYQTDTDPISHDDETIKKRVQHVATVYEECTAITGSSEAATMLAKLYLQSE